MRYFISEKFIPKKQKQKPKNCIDNFHFFVNKFIISC